MVRVLPFVLLLAACKKDAEFLDTGDDPPIFVSCPDQRDPRFDELAAIVEAERQKLGAPGVAAALMLDGELVWCEGFGARDDSGEAPTGRTLFRIGSLTKMLTAAALLQEVDAGRLDLQATLPSLLGAHWQLARQPGLTDKLTVHHLLTHQGGFMEFLEFSSRTPLAEWVDGWLLENLYMMAEPGSFFNYSNPNYVVAGRVLEHTSERKYVPRLTEDLLQPLGMDRTLFLPAHVEADGDFARGYTRQGVGVELYDNTWARPAAFAWSSVEELARFASFIMDGRPDVLSRQGLELLVTPHVERLSVPGLEYYGYGIMPVTGLYLDDGFYPIESLTHGGSLRGYSAELRIIPDQGFAFVTLANGDGAYFRDSQNAAIEAFVDLPAPTHGPDVTPPDPQDYVGVFEDPMYIGTMFLELGEEGELRVEIPRFDELGMTYDKTLQPLYGDVFLFGLQGVTLDLTFVPGDDGSPRWARTRIFVAERADPATALATPVERPLPDADALRALLLAPAPPLFEPESGELP